MGHLQDHFCAAKIIFQSVIIDCLKQVFLQSHCPRAKHKFYWIV